MCKPAVCLCALLLLLNLLLSSCAREYPLVIAETHYDHNVTVPEEVVGDADHVFVGRVERFLGTELLGSEPDREPCTSYEIEVLQNIKGDLRKELIQVQKYGGFDEEHGHILLDGEEDFFPQPGEILLFVAYAQENGSLIVSTGAYGNIRLYTKEEAESVTEEDLLRHEVCQRYRTALEDPVESDRSERHTTRYSSEFTKEEGEERYPDGILVCEENAAQLASILPTYEDAAERVAEAQRKRLKQRNTQGEEDVLPDFAYLDPDGDGVSEYYGNLQADTAS